MRSKFTPYYVFAMLLVCASISIGRFNNPPDGRTGAPGDGLCTDCHNPPSAGQDGNIVIAGLPAMIAPNTTYNITITDNNPNGQAVHGGFQLVVLDGSNDNTGNLTNPSASSTLTSSGGRTYWEHDPAKFLDGSNQASWTVDWTSPAGPANEPVTMYAAGNITNGSGDTSGDLIVTTTSSGNLMAAPDPLEVTISNTTDITCNGDNNGTATATATGGSPPYTYQWSSGASGEVADNLGPGMVMVTVTDNDGSTASDQALIIEPDPVIVTITDQTDVTCNGDNDGSATVSAVGGNGGFTYSWSNGASGATVVNLPAGPYSVTATDANGCTGTTNVTIIEPDAITVDLISSTAVSCAGEADGTAEVSATGGTGAFTYFWSNGETGTIAVALPGGLNQVTVSDDNFCESILDINIGEPVAISLTLISSADVSCAGDSDGEAEVSATGGSGGFAYNWSNGGSGASQTDLPAGTYTVTATDANNCDDILDVVIDEPDALEANLATNQNITCNGTDDGSLSVTPSGGTPAYIVTWSTGSNMNSISGLGPGDYSVTVSDQNGCMDVEMVTLNEPDLLVANAVDVLGVTCFGSNDGMATIESTGGTPSYIVTWPDGSNENMRMDLSEGLYPVVVIDQNGCTDTVNVVIGSPDQLAVNIDATEPSCASEENGSISATPEGGTSPYTYIWSNGSMDSLIENVGAGTYQLIVTDENNCADTLEIILGEPELIEVILNGSGESAAGANDGSISSMTSGGVPPYIYNWSNGDTTANIDSLAPGLYTLIVSDQNGCNDTSSYTVNPFGCDLDISGMIEHVSCAGDESGIIVLMIFGANGDVQISWSNGETTDSLGGLGAGMYSVTVTDTANCISSETFEIMEPSALALTGQSEGETAVGANDGMASVQPSGGTPPYMYEWSEGQTDSVITGLIPGTYTATVTDANGCLDSISLIVSEFGCDLSIDISSSVCPNQVEVDYCANVTGGVAPYMYFWNTGDSDSCFSSTETNVGLTVTDVNGCEANATLNVFLPDSVIIQIDSIIPETSPEDKGAIFITVLNVPDSVDIDYQWNRADGTPVSLMEDLIDADAGFYSMTAVFGDCSITADSIEIANLVGVINDVVSNNIEVFPNPTNGRIFLSHRTSDFHIEFVDLLDAKGQLIRHIPIDQQLDRIEIQLDDVTGGLYFLRIASDKGIGVKRVLKSSSH